MFDPTKFGATPVSTSTFDPSKFGATPVNPTTSADNLNGFTTITPAQTIKSNYQAGKINAGDAVLQDVGEAARQTNEALNSPYSPIGWVTRSIGGITSALGGAIKTVEDPIAKAIGTKLRDLVGADKADAIKTQLETALNHPAVQALIKTYSTPQVTGDFAALAHVANLAGTIAGTKAVLESIPELAASPAGKSISEALDTIQSHIKPTDTPAEVVGKITQAKPEDIPAQKRGLAAIDTSKVKTFEDLSNVAQDKIKANTETVDSSFGKSDQTFTPAELDQRFKFSEGQPTDETGKFGSNYVKANPVKDGIAQLETYYEKTNAYKDLARIKNLSTKFDAEGLTPKEINDLAREHGHVLNAYNANNELASGLSKQAAENTRVGMKETARSLMPDENTKAVDRETTDLINLKEQSDAMATKVQQLKNKFERPTVMQKFGGIIGKTVRLVDGGFFKGLLDKIKGGTSADGQLLTPLEIQNNLAKNLKLLDRLNAMSPQAAIEEIKRITK